MKQDLEELDALTTMRNRFRDAEDAESINRIAAEDALSFYFGNQWADKIERQRTADGRPCFTLNKLPAIAKQVLNESRQNRPAIAVNPVSDGADEDTAEALQGLVRHVHENGEGADVAIDTAFEYMVIGGFGSWRINTDYLPKSFDQDLFVARIPNPFSVYWDPAAQMLDKSDATFAFITKDYTADAFKAEFPKSELVSMASFAGVGDQAPGWAAADSIRVVEYFEVRSEDATLCKLDNGATAYEDELPAGAKIAVDENGEPITRTDTRKTCWAAISNGVEWLQKPHQLATEDIPIVTIYGDQLLIDGEVRLKGMVADLMEPARLFNYNSSAIAETMALGSKANWIATAEQIEPYMAIWQQANSRNMAVLPYKNITGVAPPSKISTEPPIQAMSAARMQSADDLRSISGVYDGTQAPNGGEESGKAILARRQQTSTGNVNYTGNLARGLKRTARILLKLFPKIYDTARIVRINGLDQQPKQIVVHAGQPDSIPAMLPETVKDIYDLSAGSYDVTISTGATDETKRQEALDMLLTLGQANPAVIPIIGDLIVNEMDFSGKKAVVARLQKALPPNLQDQQNPTDPNQLQAHNSMLMQQNQQLMQQVQKITQMLQTKQVEQQGRMQVEQTKLQATQIASQSRVDEARINAQADILKASAQHQTSIVHDHALADKQNTHEQAMAQLGQVHSMMSASHQAALTPRAEEMETT